MIAWSKHKSQVKSIMAGKKKSLILSAILLAVFISNSSGAEDIVENSVPETPAVSDAALPSDLKKMIGADEQDDTQKAYVALKEIQVFESPEENANVSGNLRFETCVEASPSGLDGWKEVTANDEEGRRIHGYVTDASLRDRSNIDAVKEYLMVSSDSDVLDYPGVRDGDVIGEVEEFDEVELTGLIGSAWGRIRFLDDEYEEQEGYILTDYLDGADAVVQKIQTQGADHSAENALAAEEAGKVDAGYISVSNGDGIFAVAEDNITPGVTEDEYGVRIGDPVAVSSDAALIPLGTFRITHYCPCAICNGPWINGTTSTGAIAMTNHTIAVYPPQIPYGSRVVINGQVYVAEDCGGGIKENCIDIYVATHEECNMKGVYYTDVYLIKE